MLTRNDALQRDDNDPLKHKRNDFSLPDNTIYLDGNSLGPLPKRVEQRCLDVVTKQWGQDLITSWNVHDWIGLPLKVGEKIAPLIGAAPGQVICCDSISVNLFKLLSAALKMAPGRTKIVSETSNFPTDLYMVQGLTEQLGEQHCQLHQVERHQLADAIDTDTAVVMLTQVDFRSGHMLDMQKITQAAHEVGALVIWDLAHSAGAVPVDLDGCNADFAVGCGYKYLNGGPGAPAFVYVATRHQASLRQPLSGWMGHASPFAFDTAYEAAPGIEKMLCGTPSILSMSALDEALDVFRDVTMQQLRAKSVALTEYCLALMQQQGLLQHLKLVSPEQSSDRGSQLAFAHAHGYAICQALIARGIIADFRAPDILRIGFAPLYNRYVDVFDLVDALAAIINSETYLDDGFQRRHKVT